MQTLKHIQLKCLSHVELGSLIHISKLVLSNQYEFGIEIVNIEIFTRKKYNILSFLMQYLF